MLRSLISASSFLFLVFVTNVKSEEIYLNCLHKYKTTTQISLSYNIKDNSGKEYVGQGLSIPYTLKLTDSDITLIRRGDDGKIFRSWNINRFNGDAELYSSISPQLNSYSCSRTTKKL
jgi:hypothetical protein